MKKIFYLGVLAFILFEIANVYFIMPIPGSQEMNSIDAAYFFYSWRWLFRIFCGLMVVLGLKSAFSKTKWLPIAAILGMLGVVYATNFEMAADTMFYPIKNLSFQNAANNKVENDRLILGVSYQGQSKAYPIQYLGYHHQVRDSIGDKPIMVTYCTVCRSGRVFEPIIGGKTEDFRLVGMDHFNALFEDKTTKSWWRQATGEAIAGVLRGQTLPEYPSMQITLRQWIALHPNTLVMQPDKVFQTEYDSLSNYETGKRLGRLTRRDSLSWQDKSWVVGVVVGKVSKAFDWNRLQKERVIYDALAGQPIAVILSKDNNSFVVLQRLNKEQTFTLVNDTLVSRENKYNFMGLSLNPLKPNLLKINAYQEYWQSWRTFHPLTEK